MEKEKSLPIVSRETIEEHTKEINKAKKSKLFKSKSNKIFNIILKENPELSEIILPTLESKKSDEYKKGYDRLTAGPAATQYIGYRFLDPKKRLNFSLGFEFTEGFTQNQRSYNFDTRMQDTEKRLDLLYSLKLALTVPIYLKKANEEEFFE